jgi:ABC-type Na+ efflux pump permease subunit
MLRDIWSVTWKELMLTRRNFKTYLTSYMFILVIWGILFPATMVNDVWHGRTTTALLAFAYLSVFLASGQTISAFVGERMQKTLGTLLTTRLSDAAIYLGKVLAIIILGYVVMLLVLGLHLSTVWYVAAMRGILIDFPHETIPYTSLELLFMLVLPIFSLIYTSSLGVYISLKSTNIRGQHILNLFMGFPVALVFYYVLKSLTWQSLLSSLVIFGVCLGITLFSIGRFNRQRLILQ